MRKWLITGGAGFIGCNVAKKLMAEGHRVVVIDNLSRKGTESNLEWLRGQGDFEFYKTDIRDFGSLKQVFVDHKDIDVILHLAAQVAVTTSIIDPREDFEINALGTFNVCEVTRQFKPDAILLNASTNKVYGNMEHLSVVERSERYDYVDLPYGISEESPLDFHSPYGCSKGTGEQYVLDYSRIYGINSVNFRQSCIYGTRQFGVEDQGWVAWFIICTVLGKQLTLFGDGKQVRDVLWIDDLARAYILAVDNIERTFGQAYNIGGGPSNSLSLLEHLRILEDLLGRRLDYRFGDWRTGDQKVFICDISKAKRDFCWEPSVPPEEGVHELLKWVSANSDTIASLIK